MISRQGLDASCTPVLILLFWLVTLSGCAGRLQVDSSDSAAAQISWQVQGKLSVQMEGQRQSGRFIWQQLGETSEIVLMDPFGRIIASINKGPDTFQLDLVDGRAQNPSLMTTVEQQLPVGMLSHWIQGRPDPSFGTMHLTADGERLKSFNQQAWLVEYLSYTGSQVRKMRVSRENMTLNLVCTKWDLGTDD